MRYEKEISVDKCFYFFFYFMWTNVIHFAFRPTTMDLDTSIDEAKKAINCFFNNDFASAKRILEPWAETSMYHSLGTAVFACLEAFLTFEQVTRALKIYPSVEDKII